MTFEEFFAKKKIDLVQLEKTEPGLYSEFKSHYLQMGEKSFDHTKKFWFNKLRRLYHLSTPEKAITQVETKIASQAEVLSSPTIEQALPEVTVGAETASPAVNKPRFVPRNIAAKKPAEPQEAAKEASEEAEKPVVKKPGFKPRNITAPAEKPSADAENPESRPGQLESSNTPVTNPAAAEAAASQGYKPKFKMKNVPRNPGGIAEQTGHTTEEKAIPELPEVKAEESTAAAAPAEQNEEQEASPASKPAYKPKFKMKNVPRNPGGIAEQTGHTTEEKAIPELPEVKAEESTAAAAPAEQKGEQEASPASKPAYKPKFNMKNVQKAPVEKQDQGDVPPAAEPVQNESAEAPTDAPAKPAYKPKFNMKNVQKASVEKQDQGDVLPAADPVQNETAKAPAELPAKPAYKPKFNMKNIKPKQEVQESLKTEELEGGQEKPGSGDVQEADINPGSKAGDPADIQEAAKATEALPPKESEEKAPEQQEGTPAAKPAYKPKFNMRNIKPKGE